jgi:hypothetical protein
VEVAVWHSGRQNLLGHTSDLYQTSNSYDIHVDETTDIIQKREKIIFVNENIFIREVLWKMATQ